MWENIGRFVLKFRIPLLVALLAATAFMGYRASKVQLSYEFAKAIPTDNPKYKAYQDFKKLFGEDGNMLVIGFQTDQLFKEGFFRDFRAFNAQLKKVDHVEDLLSIAGAIQLLKNDSTEKLMALPVFPAHDLSQSELDSNAAVFTNLKFYKGLLYNPATNTYLTGVRINNAILNSVKRTAVVNDIIKVSNDFGKKYNLDMHYSGLPLIRTQVADRIKNEMRWLLLGSLLLSAVILYLFFRSFSTMLMSLAVVIMGVIWSFGTMNLFDYKITLLNALIPPLIVVIGIPNCIYFLNKYHISFNETRDKQNALVKMVSKMGIVTLFCNIAAAIGFAVFALTKSAILKEFGVVAGINIMMLFIISCIFIPAILSFLPAPKEKHTRYLENKWLLSVLDKLEVWSLNHRKQIYIVALLLFYHTPYIE